VDPHLDCGDRAVEDPGDTLLRELVIDRKDESLPFVLRQSLNRLEDLCESELYLV